MAAVFCGLVSCEKVDVSDLVGDGIAAESGDNERLR